MQWLLYLIITGISNAELNRRLLQEQLQQQQQKQSDNQLRKRNFSEMMP